MTHIPRALLLLGAGVCSMAASAVSTTTLVEDGGARCVILLAPDAAPCAKVAAAEFRLYLRRISGVDVPVRAPAASAGREGVTAVLIGASERTRTLGIDSQGIPSEGFVLHVGPDLVAVVGNDGPAYGVNYRFSTDSAGTLYGVYRLLEMLGVRWFYPGEGGDVVPRTPTVRIPHGTTQNHPAFPYRHTGYAEFEWGRRVGAGGDRDVWSTRHTCSLDLHRDHHEGQPTWFLPNADGHPGYQADLAHPEVIKAVAGMAARRFETRPIGQRYYLVIPLDGRAFPDDGARSRWVMSGAVGVAERLRTSHPSGRIVYCAYNDSRVPPPDLSRLPPNVVVLIALSRGELLEPERRAAAYELIKAWQDRRPEAIYFCRYGGGRLRMMPAFIPHVIAADVKRLNTMSEEGACPIRGEMNFVGVKAGSPFSWWEHLNEYVTAKLLWDPRRDVDALLRDICLRLFGPASEPMEAFLKLCENAYLDPTQRDLFAVETIDQLEILLKQAHLAVKETPFEARLDAVHDGFASLARIRSKLRRDDAASTEVVDAGLACHLTFDEGQGGETVERVSGDACEIRDAEWTAGVTGQALIFGEANSGVRIGPVDLSDTDYTIEAWVRVDSPERGEAYIVGPDAWNRQLLMVNFGLPTNRGQSGRLVLMHRRWEKGENVRLDSAPFEFVAGRWVHVCGTFGRRDGMATYIDGRLAGLNMDLTRPSTMSAFWVGASGNGATKASHDLFKGFPGAVDEIRIWRRELSSSEVRIQAVRRIARP